MTDYPEFMLRFQPWLADPRADDPNTRYDRHSNMAGETMRVTFLPSGQRRVWHRERGKADWTEETP